MSFGIGTKFRRFDAASALTDKMEHVGKVKEMGELAASLDTSDDTTYDSDSGYREYAAGLKDGGDLNITLRYLPTDVQHLALKQDFEDGVINDYCLDFPTATSDRASFKAIVTGFGMAMPLEGRITQSFTFKITGPITFDNYV